MANHQKNGELTQVHENGNGNGHSNGGLGLDNGNKEATFFPGWYADFFTDGPGKAQLYKVEKKLFHGKSNFQDLFVFESSDHGKVAILDGFLQLTEKDEFAYQEMICHLPLCSIPNPKKVLLVGGGDGGILREISRHSSVEQIDICEIDTMIIDVYQRFFPDVAIGYKDHRVNVYIGDGVKFMKGVPQGTYDAIILDAFPNMGAGATKLTDNEFLKSASKALRPGGVLSAPADSFWHKNFVHFADTIANCRDIFKGSVNYAWTTVPAYASGAIGFLLCATEGPAVDFRQPVNPLNPDKHGVANEPTKFYNSAMHGCAFRLPAFAERVIGVSSSSSSPN